MVRVVLQRPHRLIPEPLVQKVASASYLQDPLPDLIRGFKRAEVCESSATFRRPGVFQGAGLLYLYL